MLKFPRIKELQSIVTELSIHGDNPAVERAVIALNTIIEHRKKRSQDTKNYINSLSEERYKQYAANHRQLCAERRARLKTFGT